MERVCKVVVGLSVGPSVCFGEILKSSDKIRCGNGIFALGAEELRKFILLYPEVEVSRSITPSWCCSCGCRASGVAGVVVVPVEIDVGVIDVVIIVIIFWGQVDAFWS
jgi:hypothetical protein